MQMQIVENWSDLAGDVVAWHPLSPLTGFGIAEVRVRSVAPVGMFPNLLQDTVGETVKIFVPTAAALRLNLAPSAMIRCRVRKAGPSSMFVHPEHVETE
jgi:hypothetical protein